MGPLGARPARRRRGPLAPLALAALLGACSGPPGAPDPGGGSAFEGRPLGRAESPRSGHLTWQLGAVDRLAGDAVRVDLRLHNGQHRSYRSLRIRVTVHGPEGERRSTGLPVGGLRDGRSRQVSAHLEPVPFPVRDVTLELVYAIP